MPDQSYRCFGGKQEDARRQPRFSAVEGIAAVMFKELATNPMAEQPQRLCQSRGGGAESLSTS